MVISKACATGDYIISNSSAVYAFSHVAKYARYVHAYIYSYMHNYVYTVNDESYMREKLCGFRGRIFDELQKFSLRML